MQNYDGYTLDGIEISCEVDPEKSKSVVEYDNGRIQFFFNPDFPQDAKAFFEALCNARGVKISHDSTHFCEWPAAYTR